MIPRFLERRLKPVVAAAGALTAALAVAGAIGAVTVGPHPGSHHAVAAARASGNPYFVCLAYENQWGICIGPPTN